MGTIFSLRLASVGIFLALRLSSTSASVLLILSSCSMSCSSDTSAYTTELDRTGATAGVPTSVTTASKTPETMRVMGSSSQSIDDVCTAVSRTLLPTPPTRSANTCAARAPAYLTKTENRAPHTRELTANKLPRHGPAVLPIRENQQPPLHCARLCTRR